MMQKTTYFDFEPTLEQQQAFEGFQEFIDTNDSELVYVLVDAAGTGKTTLMQAFIEYLKTERIEFHLAAPTGRAARILEKRTGEPTSTIHNLLYTVEEEEDSTGATSKIRFVRRTQTDDEDAKVIIIDEASMISNELDQNNFMVSEKPLLEDLIVHFKKLNPDNKLVFVGDKFQLPPVGSEHSTALSSESLNELFDLKTMLFELSEVKRQQEDSVVLASATILRDAMESGKAPGRLKYHLLENEEEAVQKYLSLFNINNIDAVALIGWRNEDVYRFNQQVRKELFGNDADLLHAGDLIIVNRTYMNEEDIFLANGEFGIIKSISKFEELAGLNFATAEIEFENAKGRAYRHKTKILLDTLTNPMAKVDYEKSKALYGERIRKNKHFRKRKDKRFDSYLNALHVKYGYAITCHKAQGGEWDEVIIHPIVPPRMNTDHSRWLYTAITRAKTMLYSFKKTKLNY
jgi:exodeoxyribonuclease-5